MRRIAPSLNRIAVAAIFALLAAGSAAALASTKTYSDPTGDAAPECDISSASISRSGGRLVFSVTTVEPNPSKSTAPWIQIYSKRGEVNRGQPPPAELSSQGYPRTPVKLSDEGRTASFKIKPSLLRKRLGVSKKQKTFYWVARKCFLDPDYAPGRAAPYKPKVAAARF